MRHALLVITVLFADVLYCNAAMAETRVNVQDQNTIEFSYFAQGQKTPRAVYTWHRNGNRELRVYSRSSTEVSLDIYANEEGVIEQVYDGEDTHMCFERRSRRACRNARRIYLVWFTRMQIVRRLRQLLRSPILNPQQFMP